MLALPGVLTVLCKECLLQTFSDGAIYQMFMLDEEWTFDMEFKFIFIQII